MTPAKALGVSDRTWAIGDLINAALATQPITPVTTAPERRKRFTVIDGGKDYADFFRPRPFDGWGWTNNGSSIGRLS
jgi:hypothetical protein